jgi:hypothetical protein
MLTPTHPLHDLVRRIQMEYLEMPGLALTRSQARRLWNLDAEVCDEVLTALVAANFLGQTTRGAFLRRDGSDRRSTTSA